MKKPSIEHRRFLGKGLLAIVMSTIALSSLALAGTTPSKEVAEKDVTTEFKKPAWLKEVSVAIKESYNSNVFMADGLLLPAGTTSFTNSEPFKQSSWITTVTPTVSFEFAPLLSLDDEKAISSLGLSYSPEIATYHEAATENYINHKVGLQVKGRLDDFTYGLANTLNYVDGRKDSLFVATGTPTDLSPTASGTFRERREQLQNRFKGFVRYELNDYFFIRPVAESTVFDLHVNQYNNAQYVNFPDRTDSNVGIDFGYKANPLTGVSSVKGLSKDYAYIIGYRAGKTYQGVNPGNNGHYTSEYHRILGGIEGQVFKNLKLNFLIGPEFRNYEGGYAATFGDYSSKSIYYEGSATYTITKEDSLQGKARQRYWVASTGNGVYADRNYDIQYTRKITDDLSAKLGYGYVQGEYITSAQDDNLYTIFTGLDYKLDDHWSFSGEYSWSRSISDNSSVRSREGEGHLISLGAKWSL